MNQIVQSVKRAQVDWRMVLMAVVLLVVTTTFNVLSDGIFFSPENLYNIAQQTAVVGILATVMVLVIVTRHIDLSIGSVMGFVGVLIAYLMYSESWSWQAACAMGTLWPASAQAQSNWQQVSGAIFDLAFIPDAILIELLEITVQQQAAVCCDFRPFFGERTIAEGRVIPRRHECQVANAMN